MLKKSGCGQTLDVQCTNVGRGEFVHAIYAASHKIFFHFQHMEENRAQNFVFGKKITNINDNN